MLGNSIHETCSAPSNTTDITLVAGTDDGDIRASDRFAVGQHVQYTIKSSVAANDDIEAGRGVIVTGNKLGRTTPVMTYDGTTYDNSGPAKLTFTTAVDVWVTPIQGGLFEAPMMLPSAITSHSAFADDRVLSAHLSGQSSTGTQVSKRLYVAPYLKVAANDISGFWFGSNVSFSTNKGRISIHELGADGGIGVQLVETTDFAPTATGRVDVSLASNLQLPPGLYFIAYIANFASQLWQWSTENHVLGNSSASTNPISSLYKDVTWSDTAETAMPTMPTDLIPSTGGSQVTIGVIHV